MDAPRTATARLPLALVAGAMVVAAVGAVGFGAAIRAGNPDRESGGGRLAVVDARGALSVVDGRGHGILELDHPGTTFQFPAWSPDGRRIAAIGSGPDGGGVYVFTIGSSDKASAPIAPAVLYLDGDRPPFYLSWSPDGGHVTFLTTEADGIALRVAPADGDSPAAVVREGEPFYWDWVDPERLLVHVGSDGPNAFIGEIEFDGTSLEADAIVAGLFRAPAVSRGGAHRAYVRQSAGLDQAIVLETQDAALRHEIAAHGNVALGFDPAGSRLAFIASVDPRSAPAVLPVGPLRIVDAASGDVRTLLDRPVVGFFWSPGGETIAALLLLDPGAPDVDEAGVGVAVRAAPAVDLPGIALHLAFVDSATGSLRSERDIRVTDTFAFQVLPYFDQYALSHRFWAPDGTSLTLPIASIDAGDRLTALPADGSEPWPLGDAAMGFWRP
jgi:TolB protein